MLSEDISLGGLENLFTSQDEAFAHCVSQNLAMSKGIADIFRKKYGRIQELKDQHAQVGQVATLTPEDTKDNDSEEIGPFIFNLVTKQVHYDKPTYCDLEKALVELKRLIQLYGIVTLSMPLIGCGLDGLCWTRVKAILQHTFADVDIHITIWKLQ